MKRRSYSVAGVRLKENSEKRRVWQALDRNAEWFLSFKTSYRSRVMAGRLSKFALAGDRFECGSHALASIHFRVAHHVTQNLERARIHASSRIWFKKSARAK